MKVPDWLYKLNKMIADIFLGKPSKTGKKGIALIKEFESLHDGDLTKIGLQPKMDPVGIWTEGWGRAMRFSNGEFVKGIENKKYAFTHATIHNEKQADAALLEDLIPREKSVLSKIKVRLTQNQFDSLVSYQYNTGGSATLFNLINNNSSETEIRQWFVNHYITSEGKKMPGLVRRRRAEADLYFEK